MKKSLATQPIKDTEIFKFFEKHSNENFIKVIGKAFIAFPKEKQEDIIDIYEFWKNFPVSIFKGVFKFEDVFNILDKKEDYFSKMRMCFSSNVPVYKETSLINSFQAKVKNSFLKKVEERMINVTDDVKYFKIIISDNTACVYCYYNLIIGSRFVCEIDLNSIPEHLLTEETE